MLDNEQELAQSAGRGDYLGVLMRLIRFILFDLALMLLAPELLDVTSAAAGASPSSVKAVATFKQNGSGEVLSSFRTGGSYDSQATLAAPGQPADNFRPVKLAGDSAGLEPGLICMNRTPQRPPGNFLDDADRINIPLVTYGMCKPAGPPFNLLAAETPPSSNTAILGGMLIVAFLTILVVILVEVNGPGAGT
ncbi:hypothetical protein ABIA06_003022 [Bradyrhizobium yuanmingense]|uniref:hypothetical protein n=1 Tax=Bradyrhizobium yuanmingense TaxID=108015 RepID=UPI003510E2CD